MRKAVSILLGLLASLPVLLAQGSDALPFTRIDRNPVTSAFAGAGSASAGDMAYSAFTNASVLPFGPGTLDAAVSWQNWAPGAVRATNVNAGVAYKVTPDLGVSAGYALQRGGADGFRTSEQVVALGVAYRLGEKWALGVNGRYASQRLTESVRYGGFSGDASVAFQPSAALRLSAGISTLGTRVASRSGQSFGQPVSAKVAADWAMRFTDTDAFGLEAMADADCFFSGNYGVSLGAQFDWNRMVFLRGGYRLASEGCVIPAHAALGAGVQFGGFRLDVSWLTASEALGNTLSVGVGYRF